MSHISGTKVIIIKKKIKRKHRRCGTTIKEEDVSASGEKDSMSDYQHRLWKRVQGEGI